MSDLMRNLVERVVDGLDDREYGKRAVITASELPGAPKTGPSEAVSRRNYTVGPGGIAGTAKPVKGFRGVPAVPEAVAEPPSGFSRLKGFWKPK